MPPTCHYYNIYIYKLWSVTVSNLVDSEGKIEAINEAIDGPLTGYHKI